MPIVSSAVPVVSLPSTGITPATPHGLNLTASIDAPATQLEEVVGVPGPVTEAGNAVGPTADSAHVEVAPVETNAQEAAETTPAQKLVAKLDAKRKQYANLGAEIERLEAQARSAELLGQVKAGSIIKARVGRADTAKEVTASVLGIQTLDNGDLRYKVYYGEGFEAETVIINTTQIVDIVQV